MEKKRSEMWVTENHWKLEIENWKLEIGNWKLEIGNWKQSARSCTKLHEVSNR